jgi:hypothetical protein
MSWRSGELLVTEGMRSMPGRSCATWTTSGARSTATASSTSPATTSFHTAKAARWCGQYFAEHSDHIALYYLPAYSPNHNPVKRGADHPEPPLSRERRVVDLTLVWLDE